ncbi:MAG: helix-turn-helix domain-containing protein [SAR202 cluster bacterium]|nr:MAG: helix-turn-helix domain-containing protein [SAR202 cluster bacterium]
MSGVFHSQTTMALGYVRSDTLPENTRYRDDGCDAAVTCLECPLSLCKYDDPGWLQRENRRTRDDEIFRLRSQQVSVAEISKRFGISTRTVHRIVQRGGATPLASDEEGVNPIVSLSELDERSLFQQRASWPKILTYKRSVFLGN